MKKIAIIVASACVAVVIGCFVANQISQADFVSRTEQLERKAERIKNDVEEDSFSSTTTSTTIQPEIEAEIGTAATAFQVVDIMSATTEEVLVYGPNGEEIVIVKTDLDELSKSVFDQLETGQWYQFEIDSDNTVVSLQKLSPN